MSQTRSRVHLDAHTRYTSTRFGQKKGQAQSPSGTQRTNAKTFVPVTDPVEEQLRFSDNQQRRVSHAYDAVN